MKRLELKLKQAAFGAVRATFRNEPQRRDGTPFDDLDPSTLRRVVVVRQDRRLGNLVMVTALLELLRRLAPSASIDLVAPHLFAPVLDGLPTVDRLITMHHRALIRAPWRLGELSAALRTPAPDLAIDASPPHHFSFLSGALCAASGAPARLGYDRGQADACLNRLLRAPEDWRQREHRLLAELCRGLTAEPLDVPAPRLALLASERCAAQHAFRRWELEGRSTVALHPGAKVRKRWPAEAFDEAAARLEAAGHAVLIFAGPGEEQLLEAMRHPGPGRVIVPAPSLRGFMALVERCAAFVSADCGPMHLAAALGVPCISIFRIDNYERYSPSGVQHRVLFAAEGASVTPELVVQAVIESLEASRQAASNAAGATIDNAALARPVADDSAVRPYSPEA